MSGKNEILESWIMVEHLSEGDINLNDKEILTLHDLQREDYYSLFCNKMKSKKVAQRQKGGIVVYFDIFPFQEVVDILRAQYGLQPTDEELRLGDKFSFALYFDRNLHFLADMTFFTECAYIRKFRKVPDEKEFREFERNLKNEFSQDFDETEKEPDKFNEAMKKVLLRYGIDVKKECKKGENEVQEKCRMQTLGNIETGATNLHSFFIDDLERAKIIDTSNLNLYLSGNQKGRKNLDCKKDSENFAPDLFEQILRPENYPLGRFPSNTEYALSLMQQVAVNLSIDFDNNQMRSVNGPPGTGKTTLLKDIFAQLIVQQSYDIAKLSDHFMKGTEKTVYFEKASIGEIPKYITENSIVVASSNNGAVQNIVNELPLCKEIDSSLIEELKAADYFRELSNAKLSAEWQEDENGKRREELIKESAPEEEKFWGVFSLEGGKADNMSNILTNIKHIHKYLEEEYLPDGDIYPQFLKQYEEVQGFRAKKQAYAEHLSAYEDYTRELEQARAKYEKNLMENEKELRAELQKQEENEQECRQELESLQARLGKAHNRTEAVRKTMDSMIICLQTYEKQRPGLLAGRKRKEEYKSKLTEITDQLAALEKENTECGEQERILENQIESCQTKLKRSGEEQGNLREKFGVWKFLATCEISSLEENIKEEYEKLKKDDKTEPLKPLDMNQEYDALQLSNPWFDETYRVAQSKLFVAALRVRKQFLYENRRNIKAAMIVWGQQEKYTEKKAVIEAAWDWINMAIPVISSTFASFSRMCKNLGAETLGHLFIDEAGQALPQAAVGAIYRSRHVMAVGDPLQIKPVLTLDSNILHMLGEHFGVTEKYLSASASVQTLVDAASQYGFYREQDRSEDSWIGIPLWVHRRCQYPMFTISNTISYNGFMVQGLEKYGKTGWFDIGGKANNKYVEEQGEFLLQKLREMIDKNPKITETNEKDEIYVITPFANVANQLSQKLKDIGFTRCDEQGKPTNIGTVHTFQGKEAPIVFFVLGADQQSSGAARWAVSEANIMNVAATRAKEEFYIIGDRKLYLGLDCDVIKDTDRVIREYGKQHPDLVDEQVYMKAADGQGDEERAGRMAGTVRLVGKGKKSFFAYVAGNDGEEYVITEDIYAKTEHAEKVIRKGQKISFVPEKGSRKPSATEVRADL
ncbi:MAG: AAA domain-containing protein [Lachnospiraceae bacterium]|nr:AAA domain-containing protein [Lachnospiraceae bacterium]